MGRSKPSCPFNRSTSCSVAWSPSIILAGSPGIKWIMENEMMTTTNSTGTIEKTLLRIYLVNYITSLLLNL
jgi:hypothetical protein